MSHSLYENHWSSPTLTLLNVLGALNVLNVLYVLHGRIVGLLGLVELLLPNYRHTYYHQIIGIVKCFLFGEGKNKGINRVIEVAQAKEISRKQTR